MKSISKALALCFALLFLLAACGAPAAEPAADPAPAADSTAPAGDAAPADDAAGEKKSVAVLIPGPAGYFNATIEGVDAAAADFGIEVIYADANWDAATQLSQIEDFIARGVDMLAVCCVDAVAIEAAIPLAEEAGIPMLAFTNGIGTAPTGEFPGIVTYVGQNEVETGKIVGNYAIELLGEAGGKVIMIEGPAGTTPQINRRAGFLEAIEAQDNIEVVFTGSSDWDKQKAITITEDLIQSGQEFDLVFAQDAGSGAGAAMALTEAGLREDVFVVAIDGSKEAMQSVRDGLIDCTTWMSAKEEGYMAIQAANDYFNNGSLPPVTQIVQILITKDNCNDYEGEF